MATQAVPAPLLLTRKQVAALLSCSERHIFNLVHSGRLRELKLGSAPRYRRSDVEQFIANLGGDGPAPTSK